MREIGIEPNHFTLPVACALVDICMRMWEIGEGTRSV
jgi:hypothetical protein